MPHGSDGEPSGSGRRAILILMIAASACYRPQIVDGGLRCALPPDKSCPDGFTCDIYTGTCRSHPPGDAMAPDVPLDARADSKPDAPSDPTAENVEAMCVQPKANCALQNAGSLCDPYCQSGCTGCAQRCSVN